MFYPEFYRFFRYDFFLIFLKDSFTELDTWLATKLKEKGKQFFFVRTFMDIAVKDAMYDKNVKIREIDDAGNLTSEMKAFMDQEIEETRDYCRECLTCSNNDDVPIYCISNRFRESYEFPKLLLDVASHLPEIQNQALVLSADFFTEEYFKAKKNILKKKIKYYAAITGLAGAIPIPGVELLIDIPLIMITLKFFKQQFSIDYEEDSDGDVYKKHKKIFFTGSEEQIRKARRILSQITAVGTASSISAIFLKSGVTEAVEQVTKVAALATLGILTAVASAIGGTVSFALTYRLLSTELDKIEKLANEAVKSKIEMMLE